MFRLNATRRFCAVSGALALGGWLFLRAPAAAQDPFADAVPVFVPGTNGGFGSEFLPGGVLGPPRGGGLLQGSFDVVALGIGGSIVLAFDPPVICDGDGPDFTVFENAFHSGSATGPIFAEYGFVAVSQDGENFVDMPYDATSHAGLAGQVPVVSNPDNDISPLDPSVSGGDTFDLAAVGLSWAAYVRITDVGGTIRDPGDLPQFAVAPNAGFDLDAVAALHACEPGPSASPTATPTPTHTSTPMHTPTHSPTPTRTPTPMHTSTQSPTPTHTSTQSPTPTHTPTLMNTTTQSPTPTPTPMQASPSATATSSATPSSTPPPPTSTTTVTPTLASTPTPTWTVMSTATSTATATAAVATATPTETIPVVVPGDLDGDSAVTDADAELLVAEIFDTDGQGDSGKADVNRDRRIDAADLTALMMLRTE